MRPMHVREANNADMDDVEAVALLVPRLHQFIAVAQAEHMTHAADAIGVPQSTLSRGMARLEADLGVALFARRGRTVRLTREGRTLLRHAERALAELAGGTGEIRRDADVLHGRVGLAFLTTLGSAAVPRLLRDYRTLHPGVRLDLVQGAHTVLLDRVRAGDVDLALTSPLPDEPGLRAVALDTEELRLVVPAGHRLAGRTEGVALAEAARETFVRFLPGFGLRDTVDAWCRESGFTPRVAFEGGDAETLRGLVGAGLGVALLPVAHHLLVPGVVELPVTQPHTSRTIGVVWARDRPLIAPAQAMLDLVRSPGRRLLGA